MTIKSFISGGAVGSDTMFGMLAKEKGIPCFNMSFNLHNCSSVGKRVVLSQEQLDSRKEDMEIIRKVLHKKVGKNSYINNLMLRNTFQIKSAKGNLTDLVIAIGEVEVNYHNVIGGTGYAICYAQYCGVPVVLLNKNDLKFYFYDKAVKKFVLMKKGDLQNLLPKEEKDLIITTIGSREINEEKIKPRINRLIETICKLKTDIYDLPDEEVPVLMVQGTLY